MVNGKIMVTTAGFYCIQDGLKFTSGQLTFPDGNTLTAKDHANHLYPVNGWYWFDDLNAAMTALVKPVKGQEVTMRQARLSLLSAGKLADVTSAIEAMSEPQKSTAKIEWEYSSTVDRNGSLITILAPVLGLSDADVDALFIHAATL